MGVLMTDPEALNLVAQMALSVHIHVALADAGWTGKIGWCRKRGAFYAHIQRGDQSEHIEADTFYDFARALHAADPGAMEWMFCPPENLKLPGLP